MLPSQEPVKSTTLVDTDYNTKMSYPMKVFSGSSNPVLVKEVTECLGLDMGKITIQKFADGEIGIQILEHVRGCDVFVIQSTCTPGLFKSHLQ